MLNGYDILYGAGIALAAPYWLLKSSARKKVLGALGGRMGRGVSRDLNHPAVMIHAVSLGEINATRALVKMLQEKREDLRFIISATTETGFARGQELYGKDPKVTLIRYPLDFTNACNRVLDGLRPIAVVLMELEAWPNFIKQCAKRKIPVVLVNGRLTESSFRNYSRIKLLVAPMFRRLAHLCVQDEVYAERFHQLGAQREKIEITGTMKFDTANVAEKVEGDDELGCAVGLRKGQGPIWVCGSTGPGEEEIILRSYRDLLGKFQNLRLAIIPRHPQRFEEVAKLIEAAGFELVRRSDSQNPKSEARNPKQIQNPNSKIQNEIILGDTMGELRKFYSLANVVFVGRTLVDLGPRQHGSDMIEPAALGKPVIVGPFTGNFADAMLKFREGEGIIEITDGADLERAVADLLTDPEEAKAIGCRAQEVVKEQQGATERHVKVILERLSVANTLG